MCVCVCVCVCVCTFEFALFINKESSVSVIEDL